MIKAFFFFKEKPRLSEGEAAADHPYPCCSGNGSPSSSLNSGAHLHFHPVLSKTIYSMGCGASRQNKEETTSDCLPHEAQPSQQSDGSVQLDPADNNVDCKGTFCDATGRCSLCFNFLVCFIFLRFGICLSYTILYIP